MNLLFVSGISCFLFLTILCDLLEFQFFKSNALSVLDVSTYCAFKLECQFLRCLGKSFLLWPSFRAVSLLFSPVSPLSKGEGSSLASLIYHYCMNSVFSTSRTICPYFLWDLQSDVDLSLYTRCFALLIILLLLFCWFSRVKVIIIFCIET
jgi:hypothetical protein